MAGYIGSKTSVTIVDGYNKTTADSTFVDATGDTMTGNLSFGDNNKAIFGAGSDLQIYHDSSHSYIQDVGTGNLKLKGQQVSVESPSGALNIYCTADGDTRLYHNSSQKLATTATGINVTGTGTFSGALTLTSNLLNFNTGSGNAPYIQHSANSVDIRGGTGSTRFLNNAANQATVSIRDTGNVSGSGLDVIGTATFSAGIDVTGTVVADGLTVDGDSVTANAQNAMTLEFTAATGVISADRTGGNYAGLQLKTTDGSAPKLRQAIEYNGDIKFYEDTGTTAKFFWDASAERLGLTGSDYQFYIQQGANQPWYHRAISNGKYSLHLNGTGDVMTLDTSGNVGIGTSSPQARFQVSQAANLSLTNSDAQMRIEGNGYTGFFGLDGTSFQIGQNSNLRSMTFHSGNGMPERMRIDPSGNLLVGSSSASAKIYVVNDGGTGFPSIRADNNSANYTSHHFWSVLGGTANDNTTAIHVAGYTQSGNRFVIYGNGNMVNSNNSYGAFSDVKLKENIIDASSQWDDIKAVTIRKYSMKEDNLDAPNMLGVIAQELEAAGMGGLVFESPDRDGEGEILDTTTKQVNYSILYMKAVKALQEAMTRIETLEANQVAMETRLAALEAL